MVSEILCRVVDYMVAAMGPLKAGFAGDVDAENNLLSIQPTAGEVLLQWYFAKREVIQ